MIRRADQIAADIARSGPRERRTDASERIRNLAERGLTDRQIAGQLGTTRQAVQQTRSRHGIPRGTGQPTAALVVQALLTPDAPDLPGEDVDPLNLPPRACPYCLLGRCDLCTSRMVVRDVAGRGRDVACEHRHPAAGRRPC